MSAVFRVRPPVAIALLLGAAALDCATTRTESEPHAPRSPEVAGLAPVSAPAPDPGEYSSDSRLSAEVSANRGAAGDGTFRKDLPATDPARSDTCSARVGMRALKRTALDRTLDAGLGTWLRGVDVEAKVDRGHFQGWLVRRAYEGDPCWVDIDLRAGDVVTRVNRRSIERPEEAQIVWTGLRTTSEIVVDYQRNGRPRTLRFSVVDGVE